MSSVQDSFPRRLGLNDDRRSDRPTQISESAGNSPFLRKWSAGLEKGAPKWTRGNPANYIDFLTIPHPPSDKLYKYRVVKGNLDLGIRPTYERDMDGSQKVNLLDYHNGYGIADTFLIRVYALDDEELNEMLIAQWPSER